MITTIEEPLDDHVFRLTSCRESYMISIGQTNGRPEPTDGMTVKESFELLERQLGAVTLDINCYELGPDVLESIARAFADIASQIREETELSVFGGGEYDDDDDSFDDGIL